MINRLIVIAGPKAVGKSYLINGLNRQEIPHLADIIKFGNPNSWQYAAALEFDDEHKCADLKHSSIDRLILHYETTRPWDLKYQYGFTQDKPLRLLKFAHDVTFVTLWAPCDVLLSRFMASNPRFQSWLKWFGTMYYHPFFRGLDNDFRPLYSNITSVSLMYANWLEFCSIFLPTNHIIVNTCDNEFAITRAEGLSEEFISRFEKKTKLTEF